MISFVDMAAQQAAIKSELDKRLANVLASGKFILGPEVKELEEKLANYIGAKYCITCASGTDALQIALMALDIGQGDEVITTAFTYVATGRLLRRWGQRQCLWISILSLTTLTRQKLRTPLRVEQKPLCP